MAGNYEKKYGECWECRHCRTTHPWSKREKTDGRAFCSPTEDRLKVITLRSSSCEDFQIRSSEQLAIVKTWMIRRDL